MLPKQGLQRDLRHIQALGVCCHQCNGLPCCGGEFFFGQGAGSQRRANDGNVNGLLLVVAAPHVKAGTVIRRHKAAENQIYNQKNRGERCDFGYVLQKIRS